MFLLGLSKSKSIAVKKKKKKVLFFSILILKHEDKSAFLQLSVCSSFPLKIVDSRNASGGDT